MDARERANPFPGLRPFMQEEADLFFGRDRQSDELVRRLASRRFLAVVGTSGSGKSSLVRAGLLPSLEAGFMAGAGGHWRIATMRPQDDPIAALARAMVDAGMLGHLELDEPAAQGVVETTLRSSSLGLVEAARLAQLAPHENLLILVDQFEELFRFADLAKHRDAGDEAPAFVKLLLEAAQQTGAPVYVVITMRSDFLGDCDRFRGLPEAISDSQYLIPRLTRDQLHAVITGPIGVRGGRISPGLVQHLLNDVGDDMDQLPVLQHALMRAWDHWDMNNGADSRPIELSDIDAIGGMTEALSRHADEAYGSLGTERDRAMAERLFKSLTERGPDNREIRRPTPLWRIAAIADADALEVVRVADVFRAPGRSFLMPPYDRSLEPATVLDISHESLIRQWQRLRAWVDEEGESRATYLRLVEAARLRQVGKGGLWGEPDLTYARQWQERESPNGAWAERYAPGFEEADAFLRESEAAETAALEQERQRAEADRIARERELEQAQALAEAQRQRLNEQATASRRQRRLIWGLAAILVLALGAAGFGWYQQGVARRLSTASLGRQLTAQSMLLATERRVDLEPAALLAVEAMSRFPNLDADRALRDSTGLLARHPPPLRHNGPVRAVTFSPDAQSVVTGSDDKTVRLFEAGSGKEAWRQDVGAAVTAAVFDAAGRAVAIAGGDIVHVLEAGTGKERWSQRHEGGVNSLAFGADGRTVATTSHDSTVRVFDAVTGTEVWRQDYPSAFRAALSADGRWIVAASGTRVRVLDAVTRRDVWSPVQQQGLFGLFSSQSTAKAIALSPDARLVVVTRHYEFNEQAWQAVEIATGRLVSTGKGAPSIIAFSPDSRLMALGGGRADVQVMETETGREVSQVAHGQTVTSVSFSPDGNLIATGSGEGHLGLFSVSKGAEVVRLTSSGAVTAVAFASDGRRVAGASEDGTARVIDARTDAGSARLITRGRVDRVAFSADGRWVIAGGIILDGMPMFLPDEWAQVSDATTGRQVLKLPAPPFGFRACDLDATRGRAAIAGPEIQMFNASSETAIWRGSEDLSAVAFSPDGNRVATGANAAAAVLDATTGKTIVRLPHDRPVTTVIFSADGRRLLTGSGDSTRIFDATSHVEVRRHDWSGHLSGVSADGARIVTVANADVRVFEVAGGRELSHVTVPGAAGLVTLSEDGRLVAVASGNSVRVFEADGGQEISRITLDGDAKAIKFVDRGRYLMAASLTPSRDLAVSRQHFRPQDVIDDACARLTRNLTTEEWNQYVGPSTPYRKSCPNLP